LKAAGPRGGVRQHNLTNSSKGKMRTIGSTWKELYAGYLLINKAQSKLELRWKRALQVAEKRKYQRKLKEWEEKIAFERKRFTNIKIICTILILLIFACAILLSFASAIFGGALQIWGIAFFFIALSIGMILVQWLVLHNLEKNIPAKGTHGKKLLSVVDHWWKELKPPPMKIQKYGDEGEKNLLDALGSKLSNNFLTLHGYMARKNLDADIVVLGSTGFWLLESKFNSGTIYCKNGKWWQEKKYYEEGGIPATEEKSKKPYDLQWLREKKEIVETISRRVPQDMIWVLDVIQGGIAFTHNDVVLRIDQTCKVEYGKISYWINKILSSPSIPNLTMGIQLQVADAISEYASQVTQNNDRKSAKQLAMNIYNNAEQEIVNFVKSNV
jgi:hypothetical protein